MKIGARGDNIPVGSYYGEPSGIVGLRLFPNPDFDSAAQAKWDPERYYTDPAYYEDKDLVRPYRVGMSCGFCHVGPSPINPPADPENPKWENLTSNPGAQYFWVDRIFFFQKSARVSTASPADNFVFQLFHTQLPGTSDTSFLSSDNINNPRTMNAVYNLSARLRQATKVGKETLDGRWIGQQTVQPVPGDAGAVQSVRGAEHHLYAACAQGRLRFRRGARRAQSRVHQHRARERGVDAALHSAHRPDAARRDRDAHPDRGSRAGVLVLESHRGADASRRGVLSGEHAARLPQGRARRRELPEGFGGGTQPRQGSLCRPVRALPFEQDSRSSGGSRRGQLRRRRQRSAVPRVLEQVPGAHQDA